MRRFPRRVRLCLYFRLPPSQEACVEFRVKGLFLVVKGFFLVGCSVKGGLLMVGEEGLFIVTTFLHSSNILNVPFGFKRTFEY